MPLMPTNRPPSGICRGHLFNLMKFEPVIGLEVHAQLKTKSKIFCACSTQFGARPNQNTCPICLGLPGVLPVLNRQVVADAIKAGLATHCTIAPKSIFARKNYFYPDLPKGYQISQYDTPIAQKGWLEIETPEGSKKIGLTRIHMEEDAGKLLHEHPSTRSKASSWVDLNRAGTPLIEIVSEPDLRSPDESIKYLKNLRAILIYLDICDGNMEEGSFRCDANISLKPVGATQFGTRTELKNMNSFHNIERALHFEIKRQTEILLQGGTIKQETLLWDPEKECTRQMRSKEEAHDYRYFPEPDLLPLVIDPQWLAQIKKEIPELPREKRLRFEKDYALSTIDAETLTSSLHLADYFETLCQQSQDPKLAANWILTELLRELNLLGKEIQNCPVSPKQCAKLLALIQDGKINKAAAKTVFHDMFLTGAEPESIVQKQGLAQVSNSGELETLVDKVIGSNPQEWERLKKGEGQLMGFFMGQVMKESKGKANPKLLTEIFGKKLK